MILYQLWARNLQSHCNVSNWKLKRSLVEIFGQLGQLATPYWCRSFWQSLDYYDVDLHLDYPFIPCPSECDKLLKDLFLKSKPSLPQLHSLNWCRNSWSVLFLSNITAVDGRSITQHCMNPKMILPRWSIGTLCWRTYNSCWLEYMGQLLCQVYAQELINSLTFQKMAEQKPHCWVAMVPGWRLLCNS